MGVALWNGQPNRQRGNIAKQWKGLARIAASSKQIICTHSREQIAA